MPIIYFLVRLLRMTSPPNCQQRQTSLLGVPIGAHHPSNGAHQTSRSTPAQEASLDFPRSFLEAKQDAVVASRVACLNSTFCRREIVGQRVAADDRVSRVARPFSSSIFVTAAEKC